MSKSNGRALLNEALAPDEPEASTIAADSGETGKARLDTARGMFITSEGEELKLRPVRALMVERIVNGTAGKPKVPQIEVLIAGRHKRLEDNPADENYQAKLAEWQQEKNQTLMLYLFTAGISGTPPESFVADYSVLFPDASDLEMKHYWVISLVPDDDIEALMEAIMGQSTLTQKGLEEAAANFQ